MKPRIRNSANIFEKQIAKRGIIKISNVKLFEAVIRQLRLPERWKSRIIYLRNNKKYFNEVLKLLETNKDLDEKNIELDKKLYEKMKKLDPNEKIANRKVKISYKGLSKNLCSTATHKWQKYCQNY